MGVRASLPVDTIPTSEAIGYAPPGARTEELRGSVSVSEGHVLDEIEVPSERGIRLAGLVMRHAGNVDPKTVLLYLQGSFH